MIKSLKRRATRAGLANRIITRLTSSDSLQVEDFTNRVDFTLLFAVVHEIPDQEKFFREVHATLRDGSLVLISEPKGHVTIDEFNQTLAVAKRVGFDAISSPEIKRNHNALLKK